jgi:hypothetical protein
MISRVLLPHSFFADPYSVLGTPTKRPASKFPGTKDPASKGPGTKGPRYERYGVRGINGLGTEGPAIKHPAGIF